MEERSNLETLILHLAKRDMYNGVGRVFVSELVSQGYGRDEVTAAVEKLKRRYRVVVVGDVIKVYLGEESA